MDTRQLRQLAAIAKAGSISAAADRLGMAQPALSAALARIEQQIGCRLFVRSREGARPTPAGALLIEQAALVLSHNDELDRLAGDLAAGRAGRLTIGFGTSALYEILPAALAKLRAHRPGIVIELKEMSSDAQTKSLRDGEIDVGFCRSPLPSHRGIREKVLSSVPLIAAVPSSFEGEADGSVKLAQIAQYGLILPPETQGGLQARILHAIKKSGVRPNISQEAGRAQTMLACVAAGLGIALVPQSIQTTSFRGVRFCPIKPDVLPKQDMSVIWRANAKPHIAKSFVAILSARDFVGGAATLIDHYVGTDEPR